MTYELPPQPALQPPDVAIIHGVKNMASVCGMSPAVVWAWLTAGAVLDAKREAGDLYNWTARADCLQDWAAGLARKSPDLQLAEYVSRIYDAATWTIHDIKETVIDEAQTLELEHLITGPFVESVAALVLMITHGKRKSDGSHKLIRLKD